MLLPSRALSRLPTSYAIAKAQKQRAELEARGVSVIDLSIGEPDLPPPAALADALAEVAHAKGYTRYPPFQGVPSLREAIARFYERRFEVKLDAHTQILPLIGSKEGLVHLAMAYADEEHPVYAREVDYPAYRSAALLANAPLVQVEGGWDAGYLPRLPDDGRRGGVALIGSPANPTGAVVDEATLRRLMDECRQRQIVLAFDAAYIELPGTTGRVPHPLGIDPTHPTAVEIHTFSKSLRVAGWRIAFAVGAPEVLGGLGRMKSFVDAGVPLPQQLAIAKALDHCDAAIDEGARIYIERQRAFRKMLEGLPLEIFGSDATLFVWARLPGGDGERFAQAAAEQGVLLMPGKTFGPGGTSCIRMAVNVGDDALLELRGRLERAFAALS